MVCLLCFFTLFFILCFLRCYFSSSLSRNKNGEFFAFSKKLFFLNGLQKTCMFKEPLFASGKVKNISS